MRFIAHAAHDLLSGEVLVPFSRAKGFLLSSRRPYTRAYYEGMRFRRKAAGWGADEKRAWVLQRVRAVARDAFANTAYYKELFDRIGFDPCADFGFDEFARLPVLERDDVRRAGQALVSRAVPPDQLRKDATGGSTGTPTEVWLGPEERGWRESAQEYYMRRIGVPKGTRTGLFWGHHLDPVASDKLQDRLYSFATNVRWFDCFRLSPEVLERYHTAFEEWRPACILAYGGALTDLAEYVLERGYRPNYPTRCLITGAEKILPRQREAIEAAFNRPVHEQYGSRDMGDMAYQLDPARTLDFDVDWANTLMEPEADEPEPAILVTKLHADGMPMLRYRIGDVGRFPEGAAPGHPALTLCEVVGRDMDRIWLPDGRWINSVQLPHMFKDFPVREFMFVQRSDYSIELKIVPKSDFSGDSLSKINATVSLNLPGLPLNIALVDEIPRTKANKRRPVISEVKFAKEKSV
jgi:phenylacetate-CoA ligase